MVQNSNKEVYMNVMKKELQDQKKEVSDDVNDEIIYDFIVLIESDTTGIRTPFCNRKMSHATCDTRLECLYDQNNYFVLTCTSCDEKLAITASIDAAEFEKTAVDGKERTGSTKVGGNIYSTNWKVKQ